MITILQINEKNTYIHYIDKGQNKTFRSELQDKDKMTITFRIVIINKFQVQKLQFIA